MMANYGIVPANVRVQTVDGKKPLIARVTSGGDIVAGNSVALNTDGLAYPANGSNADIANIIGLALNDGTIEQPIDVIQDGYVDLGAVAIAGDVAVLGQTAGALAPYEDLVATNEVSIAGYFVSTSLLQVSINNLGIQKG